MDDDVLELLQNCILSIKKARMSKWTDTADLIECEIAMEEYLDMVDRLYDEYSRLDNLVF